MRNFFKHLFQRPDYYATIWAYIIANMSASKLYNVDISVLCARFSLANSVIRDVLAHGASYNGGVRFGYEINSKGMLKAGIIEVVAPTVMTEANKNELADVEEVMECFNAVLKSFGKRGYKKEGKVAVNAIKRKLKEGYTVDDMKDVILAKQDWLIDPKYHKYFRPQTLFSGKFESYLNEAVKPVKRTKKDIKDEQLSDAIKRAASDNY